MHTTTRTLKVFLASPGDVKEERAAAEELVIDINKQLRDYDWQITLYMWEDVPPGFGRPQEIINNRVDECTVFIGLLWERWGQQTGKYSSGFEEEFERALARRKATGEPEMWMVFKAANPEKMKDPGKELSKVLEFRNRLTSLREVLYKEVSDSSDWKSKLSNWLWKYTFGQNISASQSVQPQQPTSSPERHSVEASAAQSSDSHAPEGKISQQLLVSSTSLTAAIKNNELEVVRREEGALQDFDVARLFLLSASMMYRWYTGDTLQTHEMNLIYRYRRQLELIPIEQFQLLRAVVADAIHVVPGWFWFAGMTLETVREQLLVLAEQDSSPEIRRRAIWLLREARIPLPEYLWASLPLWDDETSVRTAAFEYLAAISDETVLPFLETLSTMEDPNGAEAREARFSVLLRLRPHEAFSQMVETGTYTSDAKLSRLAENASAISDADLLKGLASQWLQMRKFAARELSRRGSLTKDTAQQLTEDQSAGIREIAFTVLAKQGAPLDHAKVREALSRKDQQNNNLAALAALGGKTDEEKGDADSVILAYYRNQNPEFLAAKVEWYSLDGILAYRGLAVDHFDAIRDELRADLENGFEKIKKKSIDKILASMGLEHANAVVEGFKELDDFIRSRFVEAALIGLAANGDASDIRFGRQYLASDQLATQTAAVRIVCRFGSAEDVPALLEVTKDSLGEARDEAGACAIHLSPTPFAVASQLTQAKSEELAGVGYAWLYGQSSQEAYDFFETLMRSEYAEDRVRAIYYFSKAWTREQLEKVLDATLQKETYYYNIPTWLDRLLYSPEPLKDFFIKRLTKEAG